MEKLKRSTWKMFAFLPKTVSPVPYSSPPLSPVKPTLGRAFSSPISLVPKEARRRGSFEPTSPKVSCMGQVGHNNNKKKKKKKKKKPEQDQTACVSTPRMLVNVFKGKQQHVVGIKTMNTDKREPQLPSPAPPPVAGNVPTLGSMKKYSSGRATLEGFDWKIHGLAVKQGHEGEEGETRGEVVNVTEPRKEINIWKRRSSFAPPTILLVSK